MASTSSDEASALRQQCEQLHEEMSRMRKQHASKLLKEQTDFQEAVEELQASLTARAKEMETLGEELSAKRSELEDAGARLEAKEQRIAQLEAAADVSAAETMELQSKVRQGVPHGSACLWCVPGKGFNG